MGDGPSGMLSLDDLARLEVEIAEHRRLMRWHQRQLTNASVARAQAVAALARLQAESGAEGAGVLHGQQTSSQS